MNPKTDLSGKNVLSMESKNAVVSALWVIVMINMLAADIFSFMLPQADATTQVSQAMMLAFAFVIEIPIAMILLSRVLKPKASFVVNLIAAILTALFVIAGGAGLLHYYFFATIEIIAMVAAVILAHRMHKQTKFA
jgi:hypothetical protein